MIFRALDLPLRKIIECKRIAISPNDSSRILDQRLCKYRSPSHRAGKKQFGPFKHRAQSVTTGEIVFSPISPPIFQLFLFTVLPSLFYQSKLTVGRSHLARNFQKVEQDRATLIVRFPRLWELHEAACIHLRRKVSWV